MKKKEMLQLEEPYSMRLCRETIRQDGIFKVTRSLVRHFLRCVVLYASYYIRESRPDGIPKILKPRGFTFRAVKGKGFVEHQALSNGQIVARIRVVFDEDARKVISPIPYKVDFKGGQVLTDRSFTLPKYRGKGLSFYLLYIIWKTYPSVRCIIEKGNASLNRRHEKLGGVKIGEGKWLRILGREFIKERYDTDPRVDLEPSYTIQEYKELIRQNGILKVAIQTIRTLLKPIVFYEAYHIMESRPDTLPKVPIPEGLSCKTVKIGKLVEYQGYINGKVVSRILVGFDENTKRVTSSLPYRVDFEGGQVFTDWAFTLPEYRGKGISLYLLYMIHNTYPSVRCTIEKGNVAMHRRHEKLGGVIVGEGSRLKVMGLKFLKKDDTNE